MAPGQGKDDMDSSEDNVDTIDLTLSSPEPEERPRMPLRQSQLPTYLKKGPRANIKTSTKDDHVQAADSAQNVVTQQQMRPINPRHLAQIINTSDSAMLKKVMLNLCTISPALSGAVARGLAPHSTFAQGVIKRHATTPRQAAGQSREPDTQDAYKRLKKHLGAKCTVDLDDPRGPAYVHKQIQFQALEAVQTSRRMTLRPTPRTKRESPPSFSDSDSDDDDGYSPEPYPYSAPQVSSARTPSRNLPGISSFARRTPKPLSVSQRLTSTQRGRFEKPKLCAQCHEPFTREEDVCMYHPGCEVEKKGSKAVWSCCNDPVGNIGCEFGAHVDPEKHHERLSTSPSPYGSHKKKPRLL